MEAKIQANRNLRSGKGVICIRFSRKITQLTRLWRAEEVIQPSGYPCAQLQAGGGSAAKGQRPWMFEAHQGPSVETEWEAWRSGPGSQGGGREHGVRVEREASETNIRLCNSSGILPFTRMSRDLVEWLEWSYDMIHIFSKDLFRVWGLF